MRGCLLTRNEITKDTSSYVSSISESVGVDKTLAVCNVDKLKTAEKKVKTDAVISENDALRRTIFKKNQELKIANDQVCRLQESNTYRREVLRLEGVLDEYEGEVKHLKEQLEIREHKIGTLEGSVSFFMDENTRLKNTI